MAERAKTSNAPMRACAMCAELRDALRDLICAIGTEEHRPDFIWRDELSAARKAFKQSEGR
jgi:hypothetical protein